MAKRCAAEGMAVVLADIEVAALDAVASIVGGAGPSFDVAVTACWFTRCMRDDKEVSSWHDLARRTRCTPRRGGGC
jgi:hypothetical protein